MDDGFVLAISCFHWPGGGDGHPGPETPEALAEVQGHSELPCSIHICLGLRFPSLLFGGSHFPETGSHPASSPLFPGLQDHGRRRLGWNLPCILHPLQEGLGVFSDQRCSHTEERGNAEV